MIRKAIFYLSYTFVSFIFLSSSLIRSARIIEMEIISPPSLLLTFHETLNRFTNESYADGIIFIRAVTRKKKNWKQQHKKKCMGKHVTICRNAETNVLIENESLESPLLSSQGFIFSEWEMWSYYKRRDHQRREKSGRGRRLFNTTATTSVLKDDAKDSF